MSATRPRAARPTAPLPTGVFVLALAHAMHAVWIFLLMIDRLALDTILSSYLLLALFGVQLWWADSLRLRRPHAVRIGWGLVVVLLGLGWSGVLLSGCRAGLVVDPSLLLGVVSALLLLTPATRRFLGR